MAMRDDLVRLITTYQGLTGESDSWISNKLFGNGTKLPAFREGGGMDIAVYERAIHWFTENWPKGKRAEWPSGVRKVFVLMACKPTSDYRAQADEEA